MQQNPDVIKMFTDVRKNNPKFSRSINFVKTFAEAINEHTQYSDYNQAYNNKVKEIADEMSDDEYMQAPIAADNPDVYTADTPWIDAYKLSDTEICDYIVQAIKAGIHVNVQDYCKYVVCFDVHTINWDPVNTWYTYNVIPIDNFDWNSINEQNDCKTNVHFVFTNNVDETIKKFVIENDVPVVNEVVS